MEKRTFHKLIKRKENGKQTRYFIEESTGYIDEAVQVAFEFKNNTFTATDILTGAAIQTGYGKDLEYHKKHFYDNMIEIVNKTRQCYYYENCKKVFDICLEYGKPLTERKINNILSTAK